MQLSINFVKKAQLFAEIERVSQDVYEYNTRCNVLLSLPTIIIVLAMHLVRQRRQRRLHNNGPNNIAMGQG